MKDYLMMPKGFSAGADWFGECLREETGAAEELIVAAVHAINSHDELVEMNKELLDKLRKASEIMKAAHNSMFEQCLSNPVFNTWGKELNLSAVNELQVGSRMADEAIEMAEGSAV
ncbi:MAG: hypothetical protein ACRCXB_04510 [Aeromonadaceae bacterium]